MIDKKQILKRVMEVEEHDKYIKRCVSSGICPLCGGNLNKELTGRYIPRVEWVCRSCGRIFRD
jgi:uncharacterized protein with PIN domain